MKKECLSTAKQLKSMLYFFGTLTGTLLYKLTAKKKPLYSGEC